MLRRYGRFARLPLLVAVMAGVSAAQFATDSPAAKVTSLTGQVSVMRDSIPWALQVGDQIHPKQLVVTGPDGFAVFEVSDGSTFEVYPNSRATFRDNPGSLRDLLEIWIGRVKVRIQKLSGQPNHNRIDSPTAVISVRGTVFDVEVDGEDETTLVVVDEGQVAVQHKLLPRGEPRLLGAGEWIRVFKNQPLAQARFDRGSILQTALRAVSDALYTVIYRNPGNGQVPAPGGGGSIPGGGGGIPGDRGPDDPPPPPTAPPTGGGTTTTGPLPPPPPPPAK